MINKKKYFSVLVVFVLLISIIGCSAKPKANNLFEDKEIMETITLDDKRIMLVKENDTFVFYDESKTKVEITEELQKVLDKYVEPDLEEPKEPEVPLSPEEPEKPSSDVSDKENPKVTEPNTTKPSDPQKPTTKPDTTKPDTSKPRDTITYGKVEYIDTEIPFRYLFPKEDNTKDEGTSGLVIQGVKGISRKEVRKVYKNGKLSHTETVKDTYVYKQPIDHQNWKGTKVVHVEKHRPDYVKEVISLVNSERKARGLNLLILGSQDMISTANIRAVELVKDYSHDSNTPHHYAEAIYKNREWTPKQAVNGWIDSSGHAKILLSPTAKYISVGVYEVNGFFYYVLLVSSVGN